MIDSSGGFNLRYYYHFDGLGSVTALSDRSGNLTESYSYDIFGGIRSSFSSVGNPYYFTGRRYDPETELYYYRERHYSPEVGRFLQTDPLEIDDENKYAYCYNDPVNWVDPYGLQGLGITPIGYTPPTYLPPEVLPPINPPIPGENANPKPGTKEGKKEKIGEKEEEKIYNPAKKEQEKDKKKGEKGEKKGDKEKGKKPDNWWEKLKDWWKKHGITIVNKPDHKGVELPGKRNIIHLGKDPRYGRTGRHIGIGSRGAMKSRWHIDF